MQVNRELNQLGLALSQLDQALESVPNEPTLLQNKLQILVLKRDWEQVLLLGQAMMDAGINVEASADAVQVAQDALEGRSRHHRWPLRFKRSFGATTMATVKNHFVK